MASFPYPTRYQTRTLNRDFVIASVAWRSMQSEVMDCFTSFAMTKNGAMTNMEIVMPGSTRHPGVRHAEDKKWPSGQFGATQTPSDDTGALREVARVGQLFEVFRSRQHHRQPCRLKGTESGRGFAKVVLGRRFGTKNAFTPLHAVEVDFQNALLAEQSLQQQRQRKLLTFA